MKTAAGLTNFFFKFLLPFQSILFSDFEAFLTEENKLRINYALQAGGIINANLEYRSKFQKGLFPRCLLFFIPCSFDHAIFSSVPCKHSILVIEIKSEASPSYA